MLYLRLHRNKHLCLEFRFVFQGKRFLSSSNRPKYQCINRAAGFSESRRSVRFRLSRLPRRQSPLYNRGFGSKAFDSRQGHRRPRRQIRRFSSCKNVGLETLLECPCSGSPDTKIGENDLCYCIYISGSIGGLKGVMIEHGNLANFVNANEKNGETMDIVLREPLNKSRPAD